MIFVLSLMLFGGKKLPELARGFGKAMREFKRAASGVEDEIRRAMDVDAPASPPRPRQPVSPPRSRPQPITDPSVTPTPPPTTSPPPAKTSSDDSAPLPEDTPDDDKKD